MSERTERKKTDRADVHPIREQVYFSYTEPCGTLDQKYWAYRRGDTITDTTGHVYQIIDAQAQPRYLDYGATPFTVRLRCR